MISASISNHHHQFDDYYSCKMCEHKYDAEGKGWDLLLINLKEALDLIHSPFPTWCPKSPDICPSTKHHRNISPSTLHQTLQTSLSKK